MHVALRGTRGSLHPRCGLSLLYSLHPVVAGLSGPSHEKNL